MTFGVASWTVKMLSTTLMSVVLGRDLGVGSTGTPWAAPPSFPPLAPWGGGSVPGAWAMTTLDLPSPRRAPHSAAGEEGEGRAAGGVPGC